MHSKLVLVIAGLVLLTQPLTAGAVTHTVNQDGLSFSPATITIEVGDTVEWVWSGGSHTVTSGTDLNDPEVGILFDQSLNSGNQTVTHTFSTVGSQDFFCRPHLNFGMTGTVVVTAASPVDATPAVAGIQLFPNVPNPFNPTTRISFEMPGAEGVPTDVNIRIFDLKGRLVRVLMEGEIDRSRHSLVWDGRNLQGKSSPSGIYVVRLETRGQTLTRTMTLAK